MGALYPGTSVSGYNSNPPQDDGSTVATNLITWAGIKSKIGDPLNTFDTTVDANITAAFGKTLDGATVVTTAVNYGATAADQGRLIKATASGITVTTPDATVVTAPFSFAVNNQSTGTITVAGSGAQTIDGSNTQVIQPGSGCIIKTDGANWFTYGLKSAQINTTGSSYGFTDPVNLNLQCSVATNILTVAVKTKAGNDPSVGDPVILPFRDTTLTAGDPVWVTISSALSINTNAVGATLGTVNSVPFRFWIVAFNNAGTVALALWQSVTGGASPTALNPLNEGTLQSTTGISAAATSAGVFYTPNGTVLTNKAFRILGYLEYTSGLATAGTYASAPNIVQLFGPGIKKPGDILQNVYAISTSSTTITTATKTITNTTASITPTATANLILAKATGSTAGNINADGFFQMARSNAATNPSNLFGTIASAGGAAAGFAVALEGLDAPGSTSSTPYSVYIASDGTHTVQWIGTIGTVASQGTLLLQEIMA